MNNRKILFLFLVLIFGRQAVAEESRINPVAFSGGDATTFLTNRNAFTQSIPSLSSAQRRVFFFGNSLFNAKWVIAPASVKTRDGLGPVFNRSSCSGCHLRDGRGRPFYTQTLAVPARRNPDDPRVQRGEILFSQAGCSSCHIPMMKTGSNPALPSLSNQVIHPYTDLLLHDMGKELADGRPDFLATGREWRTPPLWGIGLVRVVNKHTYFLHDGRARNLLEAILWHGGEAEPSRKKVINMTKKDRQSLLAFLNSL